MVRALESARTDLFALQMPASETRVRRETCATSEGFLEGASPQNKRIPRGTYAFAA